MKQCLNIVGVNNSFKYVIEYSKGNSKMTDHGIKWYNDHGIIRLYTKDIKYSRIVNDWYNIEGITGTNNLYIPTSVNTTKIKVYIPIHSLSTYEAGVKYVITTNIWVGTRCVDFGSFIFKPTDTQAIPTGIVKMGNEEYCEFIEFDIIDPYYLIYSDDWKHFRENVCGELPQTNDNVPSLSLSMYVVEEYDGRYMLNHNWTGCGASFGISDVKDGDFLKVNLNTSKNPLGFRFEIDINSEYDTLEEYLFETYNIKSKSGNAIESDRISCQLILQNSSEIVIGPTVQLSPYDSDSTYGKIYKTVNWDSISDEDETRLFKLFFSEWDSFEEGWFFRGALIVKEEEDPDYKAEEILTVLTNIIPITQEVFAMYRDEGSKLIGDTEEDSKNIIKSLNIPKYNVVNKNETIIDTFNRPKRIVNVDENDSIGKIVFKSYDVYKMNTYKTIPRQVLKLK